MTTEPLTDEQARLMVRLTDEEMNAFAAYAMTRGDGWRGLLHKAADELRERRAADLTAEDRAALEHIRVFIDNAVFHEDTEKLWRRADEVLRRLIGERADG